MRRTEKIERRYDTALKLADRPQGVTVRELADAAYDCSRRTYPSDILKRLVASGDLVRHDTMDGIVYRTPGPPPTERLPIRRDIVAHLMEHGPSSGVEVYEGLGREYSRQHVYQQLRKLQDRGKITMSYRATGDPPHDVTTLAQGDPYTECLSRQHRIIMVYGMPA
jgi:hypothetical protein